MKKNTINDEDRTLLHCLYSQKLLNKIQKVIKYHHINEQLVEKAIKFAKVYHQGQYRKSGEPFYTHPLEVAYIAMDYMPTTDIIVGSILHDTVEDTSLTIDVIHTNFTPRIAEIVQRLTRYHENRKISVVELLDRLYEKNDKTTILIKIIDRLHNLLTIHAVQDASRQSNLRESVEEFLIACVFLENTEMEEIIRKICVKILKDNNISEQYDNKSSLSSIQQMLKTIDEQIT